MIHFETQFAIACTLCATSPLLGQSIQEANAEFARAFYSSKVSMVVIGDSTNTMGGGGVYVPYYEGLVQQLPEQVDVCGFRVAGSTGNVGVDRYISFSGGSTSEMVHERILELDSSIPVFGTGHAPAGTRFQFEIAPEGRLRSDSTQRFAALGFTNLMGIYPHAQSWGEHSTLVYRTPFYTSPDGDLLESISMSLLSDHDGSAGLFVHQFDAQPRSDIHFDHSELGLQLVDAVFENTPTTRIGVRFSGDLDLQDGDEPGKSLVWSNPILYKQSNADQDHGIYIDSLAVGGATAQYHNQVIDPIMMKSLFESTPRDFNYALIWLGQNVYSDEWTDSLQDIWKERIISIGQKLIQASIDSGGGGDLIPVLITPPRAFGIYPHPRFVQMNEALREVAQSQGWAHFDFQTLAGDSLYEIDPGFVGGVPHPSQSGTTYVISRFYEHLKCIQAEFSGDDVRNFFDVSAFLLAFNSQDHQADMNGDGQWNFFDISEFLDAYNTPCP